MSSGMKVVLIGVPIMLVLAAGGVTAGIFIGRNHADKPTAAAVIATPTATTFPTDPPTVAPTPTPTPTEQANGLDTFAAPKTLDGMPVSTDPTALIIKQSLVSTMAKSGTTASAQVYEAKGSDDPLILIGIPVPVPDAETVVEEYFAQLSTSSEYKMGSPSTYDPGKFGALQCEAGKLTAGSLDRSLGMCVAADQGGIVLTMYFGHKAAATAGVTQKALLTFEK